MMLQRVGKKGLLGKKNDTFVPKKLGHAKTEANTDLVKDA